MKTLLLDRATNDLCLDAQGNLAIASDTYSILQDVATACATFLGEAWYDTRLGVAYRQNILGFNPPLAYIKQQYVTQALTVPGVVSAACYIASVVDRLVTGQIQVSLTSGATGTISINGTTAAVQQAAVTDTGQFGVTDSGFIVVTDAGTSSAS